MGNISKFIKALYTGKKIRANNRKGAKEKKELTAGRQSYFTVRLSQNLLEHKPRVE